MFAEGDVVELIGPIPIHGLKSGDVGVVVGVRSDNRTYRVAFTRGGAHIATCDVAYIQLRRHDGTSR